MGTRPNEWCQDSGFTASIWLGVGAVLLIGLAKSFLCSGHGICLQFTLADCLFSFVGQLASGMDHCQDGVAGHEETDEGCCQ